MEVNILDIKDYYEALEERLMLNYDLEKNVEINGMTIDLFAKLEMKDEKYFAAKAATVWKIENFEYVFIKHYNALSTKSVYQFQEFLKAAIQKYVKPNHDHMSSTVTGVIVVDEMTNDVTEIIESTKKFKYRRTFAFSLKGWVDVRLLIVDLHSNRVISNKKGKEVSKFYLPKIEKEKKGLFSIKKW